MKNFLFIIMLIPTFLLAGVVFEDNFDEGSSASWVEWDSEYAENAIYTVTDGAYHLFNSGAGWLPAAANTYEIAGMAITSSDYSYLARVTPEDCFRAGILGRGSMSDFAGYLLVIIPPENKLVLARLVSEGPETLDETEITLEYGETYWMRLNMNGNLIEGKVWLGDLADEPIDYMVSANDSLYMDAGQIGAFTCNFGSEEEPAVTSVYYDDIQVVTK